MNSLKNKSIGKLVLFGSGETSPTGKSIHRKILRTLSAKQNIAILETPAGFQPNSEVVAQEVADVFKTGLFEFVETVDIVPARKKGSNFSPNNEEILKPLKNASYIFLGPGSPTYVIKQLKSSKALSLIADRWQSGATLVLSSAAALAAGNFSLPVYEIYKVGDDLYWVEGLKLLKKANLNITIITHWNNSEGGERFDTGFCFMGEDRFKRLIKLLPKEELILGIDENTAVIFDFQKQIFTPLGAGNAHLLKNNEQLIFPKGFVYEQKSLSIFKVIKSDISIEQFLTPSSKISKVIDDLKIKNLPVLVQKLLKKRDNARRKGNFKKADVLRKNIEEMGFKIRDTDEGQKIYNS